MLCFACKFLFIYFCLFIFLVAYMTYYNCHYSAIVVVFFIVIDFVVSFRCVLRFHSRNIYILILEKYKLTKLLQVIWAMLFDCLVLSIAQFLFFFFFFF